MHQPALGPYIFCSNIDSFVVNESENLTQVIGLLGMVRADSARPPALTNNPLSNRTRSPSLYFRPPFRAPPQPIPYTTLAFIFFSLQSCSTEGGEAGVLMQGQSYLNQTA